MVHALISGSATAKDRSATQRGGGGGGGGGGSDFLSALMRDSYKHSGAEPAHCSFVEPHGTGDATMDVAEAQAISGVYGESHGQHGQPNVLVGTVKTNIGVWPALFSCDLSLVCPRVSAL